MKHTLIFELLYQFNMLACHRIIFQHSVN